MRELVYAPQAVADLEEIYSFIAQDSPDRAAAFVADIQQRCRLLLDSPELGPPAAEFGERRPDLSDATQSRRGVRDQDVRHRSAEGVLCRPGLRSADDRRQDRLAIAMLMPGTKVPEQRTGSAEGRTALVEFLEPTNRDR